MKRKHELFFGAAVTLAAAFFAFTLAGCNNPSGGGPAGGTTGGTKTLLSIAVTPPTETAYAVGETWNPSGMAVTATYSDGSTAAVTGWTISGFSSDTAGTKTVTVSYTEGGVTKTATFTITVSEGGGDAEMVRINGGTFIMGSPAEEPNRNSDETQHFVTVSSFWMGNYEVTQREWRAVMGTSPSYFTGDNLPVEMVSWYDAVEYCNALSRREGLTPAYTVSGETVTWDRSANGYRLPTEAEWEYACRAWTTTPYYTGNTVDSAGWYLGNSGGMTHPVGQKAENVWELYDMHGNVGEWCWDWYGDYGTGPQTDPAGAESGSDRVIRGGSWSYNAQYLRSAYRYHYTPDFRYYNVGFRLARSNTD